MSSLRCVLLPPGLRGSLWLASMPGRFESWPSFLGQATIAGIQHVACLTPRAEVAALSPAYHTAVVTGDLPFRWTHLPVPNFGVPTDPAAFREGVRALTAAVERGDAVLLHCAAGMGRTGSAAVCVLKSLGLPTEEALRRVQAAGSNPQNALQAGFVEWF